MKTAWWFLALATCAEATASTALSQYGDGHGVAHGGLLRVGEGERVRKLPRRRDLRGPPPPPISLAWRSRYGENCAAVTPAIGALRNLSWPNRQKGPAPRISRAVYINLDSDAPRQRFMEKQLAVLSAADHIEIERFSAVDKQVAHNGTEFASLRQRGFNQLEYPRVDGQWGVAACQWSHLSVLERLSAQAETLKKNNELVLILEDDAIVPLDFHEKWAHLWSFVPDDWDVLRLGTFGPSVCSAQVNRYVDLAQWSDPPPHGPCAYCGSHAYVVNPASVGTVLHRLKGSHIMHADCLLGAPTPPNEDASELPPLLAFSVHPTLIKQDDGFVSDREDKSL